MTLSSDDRSEIERLVSRYCFAYDDGNGQEYASCFTPDGSMWRGDDELAAGSDGLERFVSSRGPGPQYRHVVTSVLVDGDGDVATSRAYCTVFTSGPGEGIAVRAQGVYHDRLAKLDGEWRFVERRFLPDPT